MSRARYETVADFANPPAGGSGLAAASGRLAGGHQRQPAAAPPDMASGPTGKR